MRRSLQACLLGLLLLPATAKAAPGPVTGLMAYPTGSYRQVSLTWTAVSASPAVTGYAVFVTGTGQLPDYTQVALTVTSAPRYLGPVPEDGVYYGFYAVALDSAGATGAPMASEATLGYNGYAYDRPAAPSLTVTALPYGAGVVVDLLGAYSTGSNDSTDLGALQVELDKGDGKGFATVGLADVQADELPVKLTADDLGVAGLASTRAVGLRGLAFDGWGDSSAASAVISLTLTAAPLLKSALGLGQSLLLTWTPVGGAVSYQVFQASAAGLAFGPASPTATVMAPSTPTAAVFVTVTAASPSLSPAWRVSAVNVSGVAGALSNEIEMLPSPSGLMGTPLAGGKVQLQWQAPLAPGQALTGYVIYRGTWASTFTYGVSWTAQSATIATAGDGQPLQVQVASFAKGSAGWWTGTASAAITVTSGLALPAFTDAAMTTVSGSAAVALSWTASVDAAGTTVTYHLERYSAPPSISDPYDGSVSVTDVTDTVKTQFYDLSPVTSVESVWYGVYATDNASGFSADPRSGTASNLLWAPTLASPQLLTVTALGQSGGRNQVTWAPVAGATAYQVWRATGAFAPSAAVAADISPTAWVPLPLGRQPANGLTQQSWADLDAVNNTANAYAVQALVPWPAGVAGAGAASPLSASNLLTIVPGVGPSPPGVWNSLTANASAYALTVVASADPSTPGTVDLVWAPAGAGSALISSYQVKRGNSPDPAAMAQSLTIIAAANPITGDFIRYNDPSPDYPLSSMWYAVQATDLNARQSAWVTGTVGAPLSWGAPGIVSTRVRVGGVTLTYLPPTQVGTYGNVTTLTYLISRIDYPGAVEAPVAMTVMGSATSTATLDTQADPNKGLNPVYNIRVQDSVAKLVGPPVTVGVALASRGPLSGPPSQVHGLTALCGTSNTSRITAPVTLTWSPDPSTQEPTGETMTYVIAANGNPVTVTTGTLVNSLETYVDPTPGGPGFGLGDSVTYSLLAHNPWGDSLKPATVSVTVAPPQPTGVAFQPLSLSGSVTLSWTDMGVTPAGTTNTSNVDGYQVLKSVGAGPLVAVVTLTANTWTDTSPPVVNQVASYAVLALVYRYDGVTVTSAQALTQVALTVPQAPAIVTSLSAVPTAAGVQLIWPGTKYADAYWVYRQNSGPLSSSPGILPLAKAVPCCSYLDPGPPGGLEYYAVAGVNAVQLGPAATTVTTALIGAPPSLSASAGWVAGAPQVALTWSAPAQASDATGYNVYRAGNAAQLVAGSSDWLASVNSPGYVDSAINTGTPYFYAVSGFNWGQESALTVLTPVASVAVYPALGASPTNLAFRNSAGGVLASWDALTASTGVSGYGAFVSGNAGVLSAVTVTGTSAFLALTPTAGRVVLGAYGINSVGIGPVVTLTAWANGKIGTSARQGLSAATGFYEPVSGQARVQFTWTASPAGGSVELFYRSSAPIPLSLAAGGPASPLFLGESAQAWTYTDNAVTVNSDYYYAITTLMLQDGYPGGESSPQFLGPFRPSVLAGPASISGTAGDARVDLQWSAPATWGTAGPPALTGTAYLLYRVQSLGAVIPPLSTWDAGFPVALSLSQTAYSDTSVADNTATFTNGYYYFLRAEDALGRPSDQWAQPHQPAPNQASVLQMVPSGPRQPPSTLSAVASDSQVTLRWVTSLSDANLGGLYNVYRRLQGATADYGSDALLPWLQRVGPSAGDYPSGETGQAPYLVQTLSDPPAGLANPPAPGAPQNQTGYCYSITVVNGAGEGPRSPEVCATPFKPLAAPTALSVSQSTAAVVAGTSPALRLSWVGCSSQNGNGGSWVASYRVYRSTDGGNTFAVVGSVAVAVTDTAQCPYPCNQAFGLTDTATTFGVSYFYRVAGVDGNGDEGETSALKEAIIPTATNAIHVFCNAFMPAKGQTCGVQYSLQQSGHAWLKVYTLGGEFVRMLFDEEVVGASASRPYLSAKVNWDGKNDQGQMVASGVYLLHLEAPGFRQNARVAVIK